MAQVRQVRKKSIALFTMNRYVVYGVQLLRGIIVAKILGPRLLGIWGFLTLLYQYLSYTNFGLHYAVTVHLSTEASTSSNEPKHIIGTALAVSGLDAILIVAVGIIMRSSEIRIFEKYTFDRYVIALAVLAGITHLQQVLTNVYRVYAHLTRIAIVELSTAFSLLLVSFAFRGEHLVSALLMTMVVTGAAGVILLITYAPIELSLSLDWYWVRRLLSLGVPLLIYNMSFNLITMAGRTVLSLFYPVEAMGYYSLANTITVATLLGFKAVSWTILPGILAKTHKNVPSQVVARVVHKITSMYSTSVFLAVFGLILALPLLFTLLPQYKPAGNILSVLLLSQAVLSVCFGFNVVAIAQSQETKVAAISVVATFVVTGISALVALLGLPPVWVAVAVLAGSLVFSVLQIGLGLRIVGRGYLRDGYLRVLPMISGFGAVLCFLVGSLVGYAFFWDMAGLLVFLLGNKAEIGALARTIFKQLSTL